MSLAFIFFLFLFARIKHLNGWCICLEWHYEGVLCRVWCVEDVMRGAQGCGRLSNTSGGCVTRALLAAVSHCGEGGDSSPGLSHCLPGVLWIPPPPLVNVRSRPSPVARLRRACLYALYASRVQLRVNVRDVTGACGVHLFEPVEVPANVTGSLRLSCCTGHAPKVRRG